MDRKLLNYLPPVLQGVQEFRAINEANQAEISAAWTALWRLFDDQFLATASPSGVARWEREAGIRPKDTDTLEGRKLRLLGQWNAERPYTLPWLKSWLNTLCGAENYSVEIEEGTYHLLVKLALAAKSSYGDVATMLERIAPQNLVLAVLQLYNAYTDLGRYTHAQLAAYTHDQLRNEVLNHGE